MKALHPFVSHIAIRLVFVATISLPLCTPGIPQEKNQAQTSPLTQHEPPAVLKVTTRLITVDVVARNRRGNPVRDLQAGDFQITEQARSGKAQQQIASFRLLDRTLAKIADPERASRQLPAGVYTNLVTTKSLSAPPTILLVDGLNTDATTQLQARQKMVRLLASAPSDVPMTVFLLGRELRLLQNFTTDTKLLREAAERALTLEATSLQAKDFRDDPLSHSSLLEEMAGAEGQSDTPGGAPSAEAPSAQSGGGNSARLLAMRALQLQRFEREQYAESVDIRAKLTLDALRVIARHVSGYPGRKNLLWLSAAFPLSIMPDASVTMVARFSGMRNYGEELTAVASALTDAQIAVYPVDPRGMETQQLFDPASRGSGGPFPEGAALGRESNLRFSNQQSMQDLAEQTGGQVCLNNNDLSECVKRAIDDSSSYYELTYYPTDKNWHGEFRRILVKTTRPGVQLSHRQGYFARESDATIAAKDAKDTDAHLSQAACNDFLTATTILLEATALPPDQPGQTKYFMVIDSNALSFGAPDGGVRNLQMELATCMFNKRGSPLQYNRQTIHQKFTEAEYESSIKHGISHTISFVPKPDTSRVRLLVCDTRTGMIGSVELPHPAQIMSTARPEAGAGQPTQASSQASTTSPASPRLIKFRGEDGRTGILEWNAERIIYSGDMQAEASAKALFDSLWAESYGCESGKLLSLSDKSTPAPQPLHFKFDDNHGAEVYLDAQDGVRYSGSLPIDSSVKPFFDALRSLYQCKNPAATTNPK